MKKLLPVFLLLLSVFFTEKISAQVTADTTISDDPLQQQIENLSENLGSENADLTTLEENLKYYASHPLNLNTATREELEALQLLDPRSAAYACSAIHATDVADDSYTNKAELCGRRFLLTPAAIAAVDAAIGNAQDGYLFARTRLSKGAVSLLVNLNALSRNALKQTTAQRFDWRLLAPNMGRGEIYLVYALDGISFLKMLLRDGWPALLALTLLLAGWMAMRSARLGPLMPVPVMHRRALLEHVQAAGEFLYRRDGGRSLHNLACQTVLVRLRRRDPACAMLNGDALYTRLAERSELDAAQIAQAFQSPANAQAFRACIITLARLRSRP